jgi:hypothetical protein
MERRSNYQQHSSSGDGAYYQGGNKYQGGQGGKKPYTQGYGGGPKRSYNGGNGGNQYRYQ